ncbi:small redox-active disulfide protein 2 [Geothermobacter ehrlichii]|uniref:Small redox-active disulfide protein 2 n=1 Tax=Geothermobacter ehrlichii TaxID=213224 RepID=A0A5D3WIS9_9BACT|nr:thioredoxin family protein [Geothermobacter ehrlichii]TYO98142.1 small redox-active disulfide protein 2 [Geothermobacter ehrlichii]
MRIDILCKPGCGERCEKTLENVRQALDDLAVKAEVHVYKDVRKMIDNRVYVTPALVVDDFVRISGRVPEVGEIRSLIVERPRYRKRYEDVA